MVFVPEGMAPAGTALRYEAPFDLPAIQALAGAIDQLKLQPAPARATVPQIVGVPEQQVVEKLKRYVKAYSTADVKCTMEMVPIGRMVSLTRLVRGYKYKQIRPFFELSFFEQYSRTLVSFRIVLFSREAGNPSALVEADWSETNSSRPLPYSGPIAFFQKDGRNLGLFGKKPCFGWSWDLPKSPSKPMFPPPDAKGPILPFIFNNIAANWLSSFQNPYAGSCRSTRNPKSDIRNPTSEMYSKV